MEGRDGGNGRVYGMVCWGSRRTHGLWGVYMVGELRKDRNGNNTEKGYGNRLRECFGKRVLSSQNGSREILIIL